MLRFKQLSLRRGTKALFQGADFVIHAGQRVGITGANGCGKSSLFALIRGELQADSGDFTMPPDWCLASVRQESPSGNRSALDYVLDGDQNLRRIEAELKEAEARDDGAAQARLHASYEVAGGYQARSRASTLLQGLGFSSTDEGRAVGEFSGGWRMRLNLGQALMCPSDLLLLDEPTNHLDLEAVIWLETWLGRYPGTLLLISHDRDFLDGVASHILHIEAGSAQMFTGNYSACERLRAERLAQQQASYQRQQRERAHIQSFVDRFRAKATKARQAQSRLKALERMELIAQAHVNSPFHFNFLPPDKLASPLLVLREAELGYEGRGILKAKHLVINAGDRIGLLGQNGAGKSTLIKSLVADLPLMAGQREEARHLRIGYFAQHQLEQLKPHWSPLEHLLDQAPKAQEQALRDYLGGFGFVGDQALSPVAPFSGGEKARLVLALLIYQRPNLLLLDEPSNHLDLEMRQALSMALQDYEGAMLLVSHDRHLVRSSSDLLWLVHQGRVEVFPDSLDEYPAWLARQSQGQALGKGSVDRAGEQGGAAHTQAARKDRKRQEAAQRQQLQPLTRAIKAQEHSLDRLSAERAALEVRLADTALYQDNRKEELLGLLAEKNRLEQAILATEEAWLHLQEELETLQAELG